MGLVQLVLDFLAPSPDAAQMAQPLAKNSEDEVQTNKSRMIALAGQVVPYELRRARRRTIGMLVGPDGLEVRAPRWVGLREIEAALQEKAAWILRKLADAQALKQRQLQHAIEWCDGACFPYLGLPVRMSLAAAPGGSPRHPALSSPGQEPMQLHLGLPPHAQAEQVRDAVQSWLMRQARPYFAQRLDHFAAVAGVRWTGLSLSGARTRWGSASADGRIRLNWRLMHLKPALIDYVVVHELSHLKVMDHSPQFWDVVGQVMPDYPLRRKELRDHALNSDL